MTALTWAEVGTNTLADLDPEDDAAVNPDYPSQAPWHGIGGQINVIVTWSGAAWDESTQRLFIFGGGHRDYAGNELYFWNASSGAFERLSNPTGAIGNTGTLNDSLESSCVYFDGQPRSCHTYNNLAIRDGVLWFSGGSPYFAGGAASRAFYFDEDTRLWVKDNSEAIAGLGSLCYDPTRDKFLSFGTLSTPPTVYDPVTHTKSSFAKGWSVGGDNRSIYDPDRDAILVAKDNNTLQLLDAAGSAATVTLTTSGTSPTGATWGDMGWAYDTRNDRYLAWNGGETVYTLTPPANFRAEAWVWGSITLDAGNAVTPSDAQTNGTFGRFWFSDTLNACGVINAVTEKMYVLALGAP